MSDVEAQIQAWADSEATTAAPLPGAAALMERAERVSAHRVDRRRAWAAAAVVLAVMALIGATVAVTGDTGEPSRDLAAPTTAEDADLPVQAASGTELGFDSLEDYVDFADVVVVGTFTRFTEQASSSGPDPDDPSQASTRYGGLDLDVDQVVTGAAELDAGAAIQVRCGEVILDASGEPIATIAPYVAGLGRWSDLVDDGPYLVFLNRVSDELWAVSSSQGLLTIDGGVVHQLPAPRGPRSDYTSVLEGRPLDEATALISPQ